MSMTTVTDTSQAARTFLAGDEARIDGDNLAVDVNRVRRSEGQTGEKHQ